MVTWNSMVDSAIVEVGGTVAGDMGSYVHRVV
jgi:hypothetical protein